MIDFSNARLLTYNHQNDFLGENFRYASKRNITIEGSIYNLANGEGVSGVWSGINLIEENSEDYQEIIIGGVNLGRGRVDSLNFTQGNDVRKKDYSASITIFDTGNLFNLSGEFYSGLDFNNPSHPAHLLENFSEAFDFNLSTDGNYTYKQTINTRFASGAAIGSGFSPIDMSKRFASGLLFSSPILGLTDIFTPSGLYNVEGKRTYTESYNLITNECSFSENLETNKSSGNYSFKYTNEIVTDEAGIITVTENGEIKGLVEDYNNSAESGYAIEVNNSFGRLQDVFNAYAPANSYLLVNSHTNLKKTVNKFKGTIDYSVSYTNNPNLNLGYIWEYTHQIDKSADNCFYTVKEDGKIKGIFPCSFENGQTPEIDAWEGTVKPSIIDRVTFFYNSATNTSNPLKIISTARGHSPFNHELEYSVTYTDDLRYSDSGFKKIDVSVKDSLPVHLINKFNIPSVKELVQPAGISKESIREVTIDIIGERGTPLINYLDKSKDLLNELIPSGEDTFVNTCRYSLTPNENTFNLGLAWTYFGERGFNKVLL